MRKLGTIISVLTVCAFSALLVNAAIAQQTDSPDASLLKACRAGDLQLAADSLAKGANPNLRATHLDRAPGLTPLMFAASTNEALVKLLVERGANVNAIADSGATPLLFACKDGKIEIATYLIEQGATVTNAERSVAWAAWRGYSNVVALLLSKGAPVDRPVKEMGTPLQRAIEGGLVDMVRFLVKNGAAINRINEGGATHIQTAVRWGNLETVKFLLDAGAEVNVRDGYGVTPLMYAASANKVEAAEVLLDKGADAQMKNERGQTAMDLAARNRRNKEVIELFVNRGLMKPPVSK
jgi:ankyrin repeat protein